MATQLGSSNQITLKGSTKIVSEFFCTSHSRSLYRHNHNARNYRWQSYKSLLS